MAALVHPVAAEQQQQLPEKSAHLWKEATNKRERFVVLSGMGHDQSHWDDRLFLLSNQEKGVLRFYEVDSRGNKTESKRSPLSLVNCSASFEPPKAGTPEVRNFNGKKCMLNGIIVLQTMAHQKSTGKGRQYRLWCEPEAEREAWIKALKAHIQFATEKAQVKDSSRSRAWSITWSKAPVKASVAESNVEPESKASTDVEAENARLKADMERLKADMERLKAEQAKLAAAAETAAPASKAGGEDEELSWSAVQEDGEKQQEERRKSLMVDVS